MSDVTWRKFSGRLGWFVAVMFVLSMAFFALGQFHIFIPEPEFVSGRDFVDELVANFEHVRDHWISDFPASLLLAAGFVGLAILGVTLRRAMDPGDARGAVLAATFLLGGAIAVISQVLYLGAVELAANPQYCDCGFRAEEVISREMGLQIANSVSFWLTDASMLLAAVGLVAFASLAPASGWVPSGLAGYARLLAAIVVLWVIWNRVAAPLLQDRRVELDYGLIGGVITIIIAGILVPIWAAWLARSIGSPEADAAPD